jgi:hypothetical protein
MKNTFELKETSEMPKKVLLTNYYGKPGEEDVLQIIADNVGITRCQVKKCLLEGHFFGYTKFFTKLRIPKGYYFNEYMNLVKKQNDKHVKTIK